MYLLRQGAVLAATSLVDDEPFSIVVKSSGPVAHGSTADIYEGEISEQLVGQRRVALKVFPRTIDGDKARTQLLRRELHAARRVLHRYIMPFTGLVVSTSYTILISPFMAHGNLLQYFKNNPAANRNKAILQVAEAVDYIHTKHQMSHGDLKCENVLVSEAGDALLADFGLSTLVNRAEIRLSTPSAGDSLTLTTTLSEIRRRYTVEFAGPELLFNSNSPDAVPSKTTQADVYAFGMLIIQAFTGEPPWRGCTVQDVVQKIYARLIPSRPGADTSTLGLIQEWWITCVKCWAFEPGDRPSMRQVLAELVSSLRVFSVGESRVASVSQRLNSDSDPLAALILGLAALCLPLAHGQRSELVELLSHTSRRRQPLYQTHTETDLEAYQSLRHSFAGYTSDIDLDSCMQSTPQRQGLPALGAHAMILRGTDKIYAVGFLSDRHFISGSQDHSIRVWDVTNGTSIGEPLLAHRDWVMCLAVSGTGSLVATGSRDRTVRMWKHDGSGLVDAGIVMQAGDMAGVMSLAFSPDGGTIVSGSSDGALRVWDVATGAQLGEALHSKATSIWAVAFCPVGGHVASGADDRRLLLWTWDPDSQSLGLPRTLPSEHSMKVLSLAFSPDGATLACGSADETISIWHRESGEQLLMLEGHSNAVAAVAFSPDGRHLASGSYDGSVVFWDAATGDMVSRLTGHTHAVHSLAFSPDGTRIGSGSSDATIRLWTLQQSSPDTDAREDHVDK